MAKYKIYARRNPYTDWTAWCDTDDKRTAEHNKRVIESYGYEWTEEEPMTRNEFKAECDAKGIDLKKIRKHSEGRYKFTSADIETLEAQQ